MDNRNPHTLNITLDQLRVLVAAAEQGSFSAAGRHLRRSQSTISYAIAALEEQLEVELFDRTRRTPRLTEAGEAMLIRARDVLASVSELAGHARGLAAGVEARLSIVVHMVYPLEELAGALRHFRDRYPDVALTLHTEVLGGVIELLEEGTCQVGISGPVGSLPETLTRERVGALPLVTVCAASHPLARITARVSRARASRHTQIVVMDRSSYADNASFGVLSEQTWRVADVHTKLAMLRAGLGWGNMARHMVREHLASSELVELDVEGLEGYREVPLHIIHPVAAPPGPAGRWLLDELAARITTSSPR